MSFAHEVKSDDTSSQREAFLASTVRGYGRVGYGASRVRRVVEAGGFADALNALTEAILTAGGVAGFQLVGQERKGATREVSS